MKKDIRHQENFLFTQNSLATFYKCPLKFKKRYIENLKWESIPDEKIKKRIEMGNSFHILAQRYFSGIETEIENLAEEEPEVFNWYDNLKSNFKIEKEYTYFPEYKLRLNLGILKLEANYDLIIKKENSLEVWDWKTGGTRGKESSHASFQTMVYLFVLKENSILLHDKELKGTDIKMCYWQPDPVMLRKRIDYSDEMHLEFKNELEEKVKTILEYDYSKFDKSEYISHCRLCEFNWLCNNEKVNYEEMANDDNFLETLDIDEVEEMF